MTVYQIITLVVSVLSLCGFGVVMKLFWEDKHAKKKEATKEAKEKQRKQRHEEIMEAVHEATDESFQGIGRRLDGIEHRLEISEECDRASLRNGLMGLYYACADKGYRTEDDSKNYREMHEAYNKAGGNSFIDSDVSKWFEALPLKPNNYQPTAKKKSGKSTKKEEKK